MKDGEASGRSHIKFYDLRSIFLLTLVHVHI
jgi:hypothetical protein